MKLKTTLSFVAVSVTFLLPFAASAQADFRNQMHNFGGDDAPYIAHANQMGYDFVAGRPWDPNFPTLASAAGLGVMFNTGADIAKWLNINPVQTKVNGRLITALDRANFDKAFCIKDLAATDFIARYAHDPGIEQRSSLLFHPNWFSREAINIHLAYNIELFQSHGGLATHAGVFMDQVNGGTGSPHPGPCLNPGPRDFTDARDGQLVYIQKMQQHFRGTLGLPMSGNPWTMSQYQARHSTAPFDLYYNENGSPATNHVSSFGVIPPERVAVAAPFLGSRGDYLASLAASGIAGRQGSWFGWYGGSMAQSTNATQLLRALPNWDNLKGASERSWDSTNLRYQSSNSYADQNVVYSRHGKNGKLFVVWQTNTAPVVLRSGESVVSVKCVNNLFIEITDCASRVTVSNANPKTITLNSSAYELDGYVITLTGGTPGPTLNLSVSTSNISPGGSATITWSSSGATACTASGGWTGAKPTSGTQSVSPTTTTTYDLTCTGPTGSTSRSVTVSVSAPSSSCNQYTPSSPIPQAFASPFWVAQNPSQSLITVTCPTTGTASLIAGINASNVIVYKDVYVHKDGAWRLLTITGTSSVLGGDWFQVVNASSLPFTNEELATQRYAVAYICTWTGTWKCGCRTSACAGEDGGKWNLMGFRKP